MITNLQETWKIQNKVTYSSTMWVFSYWVVFVYACVFSQSRVRHFGIPWPVASQAALSMGLPRQEDWSELPFPSPGDLPDPGIKLVFLMSLALAGRFTTEPPGKPSSTTYYNYFLSKTFSWSFNIKLSKINRMKRQKSQRISRPEKHYEPIQHNLYSVHTVTG